MKNSFKTSLLAFAFASTLTLGLVACDPHQKQAASDPDSTAGSNIQPTVVPKADPVVDTAHKAIDTSARKVDSAKRK